MRVSRAAGLGRDYVSISTEVVCQVWDRQATKMRSVRLQTLRMNPNLVTIRAFRNSEGNVGRCVMEIRKICHHDWLWCRH